MAKVVGRHKLLKITQKIENLSKFIISKQIELIITKFPTKKSPRRDYFTGDFYQMLLRISVSSSQNLPKREEWVTLSNLFHEVNTTLKLNTKTSHENCRLISFINLKNSQQSTGKLNSIVYRKGYIP